MPGNDDMQMRRLRGDRIHNPLPARGNFENGSREHILIIPGPTNRRKACPTTPMDCQLWCSRVPPSFGAVISIWVISVPGEKSMNNNVIDRHDSLPIEITCRIVCRPCEFGKRDRSEIPFHPPPSGLQCITVRRAASNLMLPHQAN